MTETKDVPSIRSVAEKAKNMKPGESIEIDSPEGEKQLVIFAESIKGRSGYRVVQSVPGKGISRRYVDEARHFEVSKGSTFKSSLMHGYRWMGLDAIAYL